MRWLRVVVLTTGLSGINKPEHLKEAEGYESVSVDPSEYEGKTVLIFGG